MLGRSVASFAAILLLTTIVYPAPIFILSTAPDVASAPISGLLNLVVFPNTTGTFNISVASDIQLAGISLDLIATGGAIKFTGVTIANPTTNGAARWFALDGPQVVTDNEISNIGGAAIPGLSGNGIGQGSIEGYKGLVATVSYAIIGFAPSNLRLQVGNNTVADWGGDFPLVFFGTGSGPGFNGGIPGNGGTVGSVFVYAIPEPTSISLLGLALIGKLSCARRRHTATLHS